MPISQATILAIYGDLCDLVEKIETVKNQATQPDLWWQPGELQPALIKQIEALYASAHDAQRQAITHIMADEPKLHVHPLTGRIDE